MFSPLEDGVQQQRALEKKRYKRARWGARHLIHESFEDNFPALRDRFARKRIAAEQKYEYNLGTRTFETMEAAEDGMAWLRALFVQLDNQCDRIKQPEDSKTVVDEDSVSASDACRTLRSFLQEELTHWRIQPSARVGREKKKVLKEETIRVRVSEEGPLCMDLRPCVDGVKVVEVKAKGIAQTVGLKPGDLIVQINDLDGPSLGKLPSAEAIHKFGQRPIDLVVKRVSDKRTLSNSPPPAPPQEDEEDDNDLVETPSPPTPPKIPFENISSPATPTPRHDNNKPVDDDASSDMTRASPGAASSGLVDPHSPPLFINVAQYNQSDQDDEIDTPTKTNNNVTAQV